MSVIYSVEDDLNIRELIEYTLISSGFEVRGFDSGGGLFEGLSDKRPDMILLDIMLPDIDGMEILRRLRSDSKTESIPVILLTAKSERMDKIKGLDRGADDYITKPFDVLELVSRVRAVLRRCRKDEKTEYKNLSINSETREVKLGTEDILLTYKEFELLRLLVSGQGTVVPREKMLEQVWGTDFEGESRTLDVHMRSLRKKLKEAGDYIETVRNVGYKLG